MDSGDDKREERNRGTWVKVEKPEGKEDSLEDVEDPDWGIVDVDDAEYIQRVDGWEIKKDGRGQCRVN